MSLNAIGICTDRSRFLALHHRHHEGVQWIRGNLGLECDVKRGTITFNGVKDEPPKVSLLERNSLLSSEHARRYGIGIASLVSPWANMLNDPPFPKFNRQVSRFASRYDQPGYFPMSFYEHKLTLLLKKLLPQIEAREKEYKRSLQAGNKAPGNSDDEQFLATLGSTMSERSPEQVEAARKKIVANQERRNLRKVIPVTDEVAISTVFENADVAYILATLSSNDVGIRHKNDSVRMGAINIIDGIAQVVIPCLIQAMESMVPIIGKTTDQIGSDLIDESLEVLLGIQKILTAKNYGVNDRNSNISSKASSIERYVYDACIKLKEIRSELLSTSSPQPL